MPTIVVNDPNNVTVDGTPVGSIPDVLANYGDVPGIRSAVLAALQAWKDDMLREHAIERGELAEQHGDEIVQARAAFDQMKARHVADLDALGASHAERVEAFKAKHAEALAAKDAEIGRLKAKVAEQKSLIDALGGTELGQRMAREAECRRLHEQRANIEARLAEIAP